MIVNTTNRVAIVHMLLFQHCLYKWSCLFLQDGDEELWPSLQTGAYLAPDKPMALTWCLGYQCRRPGYAPVQETHRTMGRVCAFCFCISWMYTLRLCTSLWDTCSFTPLLLSYWIPVELLVLSEWSRKQRLSGSSFSSRVQLSNHITVSACFYSKRSHVLITHRGY